ncbi:MAG: hypothetical protein AAB289_08325, partial [Chloroflexota bacterium]
MDELTTPPLAFVKEALGPPIRTSPLMVPLLATVPSPSKETAANPDAAVIVPAFVSWLAEEPVNSTPTPAWSARL